MSSSEVPRRDIAANEQEPFDTGVEPEVIINAQQQEIDKAHAEVGQLRSQRDGWMRTAQTSDSEVAWLRKALGITSTEESCAIRDAMKRVYGTENEPAALADLSKLTVSATRGAIWLEEVWREQAQMWERRCNEATRSLSDAGLLAKPPQPVMDALESWLESEAPNGVEVTSEDMDRNTRWSVVRQWFEAARG